MNRWTPALALSLGLVVIPEAAAEDCGRVDCDFGLGLAPRRRAARVSAR